MRPAGNKSWKSGAYTFETTTVSAYRRNGRRPLSRLIGLLIRSLRQRHSLRPHIYTPTAEGVLRTITRFAACRTSDARAVPYRVIPRLVFRGVGCVEPRGLVGVQAGRIRNLIHHFILASRPTRDTTPVG